MEENKSKPGFDVSVKSFISAIIVVFVLMVIAYILTLTVPAGEYLRNADGTIAGEESFAYTEGGIPFWKWLLSPVLVLGSSDGTTLIAMLVFLLVIGGVFNSVNECGLMEYLLNTITAKFGSSRYRLMAVIMFFFMMMGSLLGSFEEVAPLVPIVTALAINLGWDTITGVAMSLLATGCGFAAGVFNPFTVGLAQRLAGLQMFSGTWLRLLSFVLIYSLLLAFTRTHAKKVERPVSESIENGFVRNAKMDKGVRVFGIVLGVGIAALFSSSFITALQDYSFIIVSVMFLAAGISSSLVSGMSGKELRNSFVDGVKKMLPAILMILMASSIKYILTQAKIIDTVLHSAVGAAGVLPRWAVVLFIYLVVLVMNFFIPSGSAKAFMLIPLIVPLAAVFGIPAQLCIVAFAFGDGFSNVFYPTNPVLLIGLGLVNETYTHWFKWSWKFQAANLLLTCLLLLFGLGVGYC